MVVIKIWEVKAQQIVQQQRQIRVQMFVSKLEKLYSQIMRF
jgi:hypothetical protein